MTSSSYPPSTLAFSLLNQLLHSLLPVPVSSTSSTFTLSMSSIPSLDTATITFTSSTLPPISYLMITANQPSAPPTQTSSSSLPSSSSSNTSLPLSPHDAVATSAYLRQYSAVRQLTNEMQQRKPCQPKHPQLPPGKADTPTRRIVHNGV